MNTVNLAKLYLNNVQLKDVKIFPEHQTVKVEEPEDEDLYKNPLFEEEKNGNPTNVIKGRNIREDDTHNEQTNQPDPFLPDAEDVDDEDFLFRGITENEHTRQQLIKALNDYKSDSRNTVSNDFYRSIVFECILYDEIFKANGKASFFDKACQIVNDKKSILQIFKPKYENTAYPKDMIEAWLKYFSEIPFNSFLLDEEFSVHCFMIAYHYVLQPKTS